MVHFDPLEVSPYLTLPRRDVKSACRALVRHAGRGPACETCTISDLCRKSKAHNEELPWLRSTGRLPSVVAKPDRQPESISAPSGTQIRSAGVQARAMALCLEHDDRQLRLAGEEVGVVDSAAGKLRRK